MRVRACSGSLAHLAPDVLGQVLLHANCVLGHATSPPGPATPQRAHAWRELLGSAARAAAGACSRPARGPAAPHAVAPAVLAQLALGLADVARAGQQQATSEGAGGGAGQGGQAQHVSAALEGAAEQLVQRWCALVDAAEAPAPPHRPITAPGAPAAAPDQHLELLAALPCLLWLEHASAAASAAPQPALPSPPGVSRPGAPWPAHAALVAGPNGATGPPATAPSPPPPGPAPHLRAPPARSLFAPAPSAPSSASSATAPGGAPSGRTSLAAGVLTLPAAGSAALRLLHSRTLADVAGAAHPRSPHLRASLARLSGRLLADADAAWQGPGEAQEQEERRGGYEGPGRVAGGVACLLQAHAALRLPLPAAGAAAAHRALQRALAVWLPSRVLRPALLQAVDLLPGPEAPPPPERWQDDGAPSGVQALRELVRGAAAVAELQQQHGAAAGAPGRRRGPAALGPGLAASLSASTEQAAQVMQALAALAAAPLEAQQGGLLEGGGATAAAAVRVGLPAWVGGEVLPRVQRLLPGMAPGQLIRTLHALARLQQWHAHPHCQVRVRSVVRSPPLVPVVVAQGQDPTRPNNTSSNARAPVAGAGAGRVSGAGRLERRAVGRAAAA